MAAADTPCGGQEAVDRYYGPADLLTIPINQLVFCSNILRINSACVL